MGETTAPTPITQPTETRWLDDVEMRAWRSYVETQADLNTAIEADLRPTGLSLGDYQVLVFLSEALQALSTEPVSRSQVIEAVVNHPAALTGVGLVSQHAQG